MLGEFLMPYSIKQRAFGTMMCTFRVDALLKATATGLLGSVRESKTNCVQRVFSR